MRRCLVTLVLVSLSAVACGAPSSAPDSGSSVRASSTALSGCQGRASSSVPASGSYFLTSFGFSPGDDGEMSCGQYTRDGSWYYAASRQRYGCGSHIQITANGKCVVAETDDYGPDVCVENAAGEPIIDASPLVSDHLFGTQSAGWSDRLAIQVVEVDASTPLGVCDGNATGGTGSVADSGGADDSSSTGSGATCASATLGRTVDEGTCVQARSDSNWYQCTASGWEQGVSNGSGPIGACTATYPL